MEKKRIYWGLGILAIAGLSIWAYKTRLPKVSDIKVSADGTVEVEKDICDEDYSESNAEKSNVHGGGHDGGGHDGRGWGRRGLRYGAGWGYGGNCSVKDANGTMAIVPCGYELNV